MTILGGVFPSVNIFIEALKIYPAIFFDTRSLNKALPTDKSNITIFPSNKALYISWFTSVQITTQQAKSQ